MRGDWQVTGLTTDEKDKSDNRKIPFITSSVVKNKTPFRKGVSSYSLSGRKDSNLRPLAPHASALAGLRHAPIEQGGL
jgi:hypothetical protein